MNGTNTNPKQRCKRCDKLLRYYKAHELCSHCNFLRQFRPWEYDAVAWQERVMREARIVKAPYA